MHFWIRVKRKLFLLPFLEEYCLHQQKSVDIEQAKFQEHFHHFGTLALSYFARPLKWFYKQNGYNHYVFINILGVLTLQIISKSFIYLIVLHRSNLELELHFYFLCYNQQASQHPVGYCFHDQSPQTPTSAI